MLGIWKRVKFLMDTQRLSHANVENAIGVSQSQLSSWINNDRYPRADLAMKLAELFCVSLEWLLTGEDEKAVSPEFLRLLRNKPLMAVVEKLERANMRQMNAIVAVLDAFGL